jgi:hypothetical protein
VSLAPSERADAQVRRMRAEKRPAEKKRRASAHVGLAIFAGVLTGSAAVAMFMALAGPDDRHVPSPAAEPPAVVAPAAIGVTPDPIATASAAAIAAPIDPREALPESAGSALPPAPLGAATSLPLASPVAPVAPVTPMAKTCDLALFYAQRGEIAQAIRRFESCLSAERELVRERIGQKGAADVRAKAEKGQCDEAAAIVAQIESIAAAGPAKVALAARCGSRAHENAIAEP